MIHCIPQLKSTVERCEVMKPSRMSKFCTGIYASLQVYLLSRCKESELVMQWTETGYRACISCWFNLSTHAQLQALDCRVFSSFNGSIWCKNIFFTSFYFGRNYSLLGVKQEVVCVADACLFGFHVSMATGTYLPCPVSKAVHTVHAMCHYCILHTFLQSKEQRV